MTPVIPRFSAWLQKIETS